MPSSLTITYLVENSVALPQLRAEHGLAAWIDTGDRCLLFDTGQSRVLIENAEGLGIDLDALDTVALSHGHYDHGGGLAEALAQAAGPVAIYAHPRALLPKYRKEGAGVRDIGLPTPCLDALRREGVTVQNITGPTEIAAGLFLTGEIPRIHPEEDHDEGFRLDAEGRVLDPLLDDQSLYFKTPAGTVVLMGCAHSGVINTLDYIRRLTGDRPFHTILGGLHLKSASQERIAWTVAALRTFSFQKLYPTHCTGTPAVAALWAAFPEQCVPCGVGTALTVSR